MKKILFSIFLLLTSFAVYSQDLSSSINNSENVWEKAWPQDAAVPSYALHEFVFLKNKTILAASLLPNEKAIYKKSFGGNWTPTGYGLTSIGGWPITRIIADKFDNIFVSTSDGVYKSSDEGKTWINLKFLKDYTTTFEYDVRHNILYVALWNGFYKSSDNGKTWEEVPNPWILPINVLKTDSKGNLYVGTSWHGLYVLHYDTNQWEELHYDMGKFKNDVKSISEIYIDQNDIIYLGTTEANDNSNIFKSIDGGKSWTKINAGLPSSKNGIINFTMDKNGNLYVGLFFESEQTGVYKLTQGSDHWVQLNNGRHNNGVGALTIDNNTQTLYAIDAVQIPFNIDQSFVYKLSLEEVKN